MKICSLKKSNYICIRNKEKCTIQLLFLLLLSMRFRTSGRNNIDLTQYILKASREIRRLFYENKLEINKMNFYNNTIIISIIISSPP
jgi:hypothetical protein